MVRALRPMNASPDWKLPTVSEMEPLKRQRSLIYAHLCQGEKWPSRYRPRLFYSQPRQLPCAWHPVLKLAHLPLSHLFCLRKWIVPTDNMQPNLHDEYTCHQWLKGFKGLISSSTYNVLNPSTIPQYIWWIPKFHAIICTCIPNVCGQYTWTFITLFSTKILR